MNNPKEIKNVKDLLEIIQRKLDKNAEYCYRGQSDEAWGLTPSIFRSLKFSNLNNITPDKREQEIQRLKKLEEDNYSDLANRFMNFIPNADGDESAWEVLIYAQHHGIPTRLLDWSSNPLVALYFATCDNEDKDGRIWVAKLEEGEPNSIRKLKDVQFGFLNPLLSSPKGHQRETDRIIFFQPPEIDARIRSQSSLFSVSEQLIPEISASRDWDKRKFIIPSTSKHTIQEELKRLGIDEFTLFPDIDGVSRLLNKRLKRDTKATVVKKRFSDELKQMIEDIQIRLSNRTLIWQWHPNGKFELTLHYQEQEYAVLFKRYKSPSPRRSATFYDFCKEVEKILIDARQLKGKYYLFNSVSYDDWISLSDYGLSIEDIRTQVTERIQHMADKPPSSDEEIILIESAELSYRFGEISILKQDSKEDRVIAGMDFSWGGWIDESLPEDVEGQLASELKDLNPHRKLSSLLLLYIEGEEIQYDLSSYVPHIRGWTQGFTSVFVRTPFNNGFVKDEIFGVPPMV